MIRSAKHCHAFADGNQEPAMREFVEKHLYKDK